MEYVRDDVFSYLRKCRDEGRSFDMIILDPPKFAESKSQIMKAARGYKDINLLAMKLLKRDGYLATFSCSGAMTADLFDRVVSEAAEDAGRTFQIVSRTRQGADHPQLLSFPEGWYLKGLVLRSVG
jgi:23S rRNA (cytosine1962-C5)-methyltransferase